MSEVINFREHKKQLVVKALNRHKYHQPTAKALGVSPRTLSRMKKRFHVSQDAAGNYMLPEKPIIRKVTWTL